MAKKPLNKRTKKAVSKSPAKRAAKKTTKAKEAPSNVAKGEEVDELVLPVADTRLNLSTFKYSASCAGCGATHPIDATKPHLRVFTCSCGARVGVCVTGAGVSVANARLVLK
ncbi:MAG: hypothetical protein Kow0069_12080 [Promethearchaeota archaeon]